MEFDAERRDRYGRLFAYVFSEKGEMINAEIVRKGLVLVMTVRPNLKYRDFLLSCQRDAVRRKAGFWSRKLGSQGAHYVASTDTFRFHRADCKYADKIPPANRLFFKTVFEAFWAGTSPWKTCEPCLEQRN